MVHTIDHSFDNQPITIVQKTLYSYYYSMSSTQDTLHTKLLNNQL